MNQYDDCLSILRDQGGRIRFPDPLKVRLNPHDQNQTLIESVYIYDNYLWYTDQEGAEWLCSPIEKHLVASIYQRFKIIAK
jgi:hypothetical protein